MTEEPITQESLPPDQPPPPWQGGPEITASQLEEVRLAGSREYGKKLVAALVEHGQITVVPDAAPEE